MQQLFMCSLSVHVTKSASVCVVIAVTGILNHYVSKLTILNTAFIVFLASFL